MQKPGKATSLILVCSAFGFAAGAWSQGPGSSNFGVSEPRAQISDPPIQPGPDVPALDKPQVENPYAGNDEAIKEGGRFYTWYNCSGCHAPRGGGGMGPPLSDDQWIYGDDPISIFNSIWRGRPAGMPTWAGMIPEDAVWKIVAFIQAMPPENPPLPEER